MLDRLSAQDLKKFLGVLENGGDLKASPETLASVGPRGLETLVKALKRGGGWLRPDPGMPKATLLAYLSGWDDCSEVVLRLPRAENVPSYPETPPDGATRRETGQNLGSSESSTLQIDQVEPGSHGIRRRSPNWDPVADPLGYLRFDSQNDRSK